jgi:hypothetical protein
LDGPGFEHRYELRGFIFFKPVHTGHGAHPDSSITGTEVLSRGKGGRGVKLTHPNLVPRLKKEQSYISSRASLKIMVC